MKRTAAGSGFTLIELLAVMSISSVFMMLAIAWIGETLKFASRTASHRHQHQQLMRLDRDLRNDVHLSPSMTIEDDGRLVLHRADGQRIIWSFSGTTIQMERPGGVQVRRESYRLAPGSRIQWDTRGMPESIGLIVFRAPPHTTAMKNESSVDGSGSSNGDDAAPAESLPVDIHIVAHANRWPALHNSIETEGDSR